jgi:hypothetical protein
MSQEPHVADAETLHLVTNINPDFCKVGQATLPFDLARQIPPQKSSYSKSVSAHSKPVLMVNSVVQGVVGNAGKGVQSQVATGAGHVVILEGASTVFVEDRALARHNDLCAMNVKA